MTKTCIRSAQKADAAQLRAIYAPYVEHTAITFEYEVPTLEEFASRIERTLQKYPYVVLEEEGIVLGYAYAGSFVGRTACDRSCEVSIYLDQKARGKGYGRALYAELERRLRDLGMLNMYAIVADPVIEDEYLTKNSERFHTHMGFSTVGTCHKCGYKFGRWYNLLWMEKLIGEHE